MTIAEIVRDASTQWTRCGPANGAAVDGLATDLPSLPADFLAFLRLSDGGEGEMGFEPGRFQLWSAEQIAGLNRAYNIPSQLPGYVGFGSSGGGNSWPLIRAAS